jgi:hypothetical protein
MSYTTYACLWRVFRPEDLVPIANRKDKEVAAAG